MPLLSKYQMFHPNPTLPILNCSWYSFHLCLNSINRDVLINYGNPNFSLPLGPFLAQYSSRSHSFLMFILLPPTNICLHNGAFSLFPSSFTNTFYFKSLLPPFIKLNCYHYGINLAKKILSVEEHNLQNCTKIRNTYGSYFPSQENFDVFYVVLYW